ncbi:MAG: type VII secretion protein EssC [Clostridia bacterium]|nr:type VII secretion protein EssC [Clostridia bacterium]
MIVNLIKSNRMFSTTLPKKVKGQYWISDLDEGGAPRRLVSIEAVNGSWVLKSNKKVSILDNSGNKIASIVLAYASFLNIKVEGSDEKVMLFVEKIDESRQTLTKIMAIKKDSFTIGRSEGNNIFFDNRYVSGQHAKLTFDGNGWSIEDLNSRNGTYVNGFSVKTRKLSPGDFIYIMGLKIIIGNNYFAVNNPDNKVNLRSESLSVFPAQPIVPVEETEELPIKRFFQRSPRFSREIERKEIKIDPPPQLQKADSVPMALMLGPSLTMGMTSVSTGIISVMNVVSSGGNISQALPTLLMSVSMLLGTILWPLLTKRYEKKQKIKNEKERQEKYLAYLNEISDQIKGIEVEQSDILNKKHIDQNECAYRITNETPNLWERVSGQDDFLEIRLGTGSVKMDLDVKYPEKRFTMDADSLQNAMLALAESPMELHNVPIILSLRDNIAAGIYGDDDSVENMFKSLILQMVALHSYDELKVMVITDENNAKKWDFVKFIPHFWSDDKTVRFFATNPNEIKELSAYIENNILSRPDAESRDRVNHVPYYVIIATESTLNKKTGVFSQLLNYKNNAGFTLLFAGENFSDFPKETKSIIHANGDESQMFDKDNTTGSSLRFRADKLNESVLEKLSYSLANIELDLTSKNYILPTMLTFLEMFNVSKVEHLNSLTRWKENNPTKTLQTPIGVDTYGETFLLDLHEKYHGPHGLVAGMTGSGKSEFIITYILSLAVNYHPDEVAFILIDYKGGGLTGAFENPEKGIKLPHLAGTITNLDGSSIKRSLVSIQSELRRRQAIFNEARKIANEGTMDIYKYQQLYRDKVVTEPVPHLFIISDEFAELKTQQPEFMQQLISAARIGRSLGVHLILATQKPSGVVDDQIWSNSKFRVCLKVQEKSDSQDMIKCSDAAELSQTGRFYLQVGFNELFALGQSAWCGAEYIPSDTVEKKVDSAVQVIDNLGRIIMTVKPESNKAINKNNIKQIVSIVNYLSELATEEKVTVRPLWLDPIPEKIFIDALEEKYSVQAKGITLNPIVGEYDDPFNQKQGVLTVPFSREGNCLVYGSTGNGKTTFLTAMCYSLLKHHTPEELNLYIMDFGSETLKVFEKAPQVGGVILSAEEEKITNYFRMMHRELEHRKALFSDFGGDHESYCRNSGKLIPSIVTVINNYSGFAELYEDLQEELSVLARDGVKYGIYFAVSANAANAVRYRMQQNFKMMLTMQLNDIGEYSIIVGKTDGLVPSKFKGRGLVNLDKVYEFQTAYCKDVSDIQEYLRNYCKEQASEYKTRARAIPLLPNVVDKEFVSAYVGDISRVPVGVSKATLDVELVNLENKVVLPVLAHDISEMASFAREFINVLNDTVETVVIDAEKLISEQAFTDAESIVQSIFDQMVERNNVYKDAKLDLSSLDGYSEKAYIIIGFKRFVDQLSADGKDKLFTLLDKAEPFYKLHFVVMESANRLNTYNYEAWYKRTITGSDGIWIGDGIADQYVLKLNKITRELYDENGNNYGYLVYRNRPNLIKLLSNNAEEDR